MIETIKSDGVAGVMENFDDLMRTRQCSHHTGVCPNCPEYDPDDRLAKEDPGAEITYLGPHGSYGPWKIVCSDGSYVLGEPFEGWTPYDKDGVAL